jgi:hypothetical protein
MITLRRLVAVALLLAASVLAACVYDPYTGAYVPCCGYYGTPYYGYPYYRYPPPYYYGPQPPPYYAQPSANQPNAYPNAPPTEPPPPSPPGAANRPDPDEGGSPQGFAG